MSGRMETLRGKLGKLPEGRYLAGFSGGADSTAMIRLLSLDAAAGKIQIEAFHVNHGLRGAESDGDEAFCREVCKELGIPFRAAKADLGGRTDENACREARFRLFRERMEETGVRNLILAHNRDDQAETFLMRLMRGAGMEGLGCMSARDERDGILILRPMLKMSREEIREALREDGFPWREDSTNESGDYLRNRVRKALIPLMEDMTEGAAEHIARTAEILGEENRMLQETAERFLRANATGCSLAAEPLAKLPEAMRKRMLRTWWQENAPERKEHALSARQTEELEALVHRERGRINLPGGLHAVRGKQALHLTGLPETKWEEIPYRNGILRMGGIELRTLESQGGPGNGKRNQEIPEDFLKGCTVRTRRDGDRIRPFGMDGTRKLQDYLTDRGIDEPWRDRIPLLCRGNEVLLAAGIGAGGVPRWNPEEKNLRLEWRGRMPWCRTESEGTADGREL